MLVNAAEIWFLGKYLIIIMIINIFKVLSKQFLKSHISIWL